MDEDIKPMLHTLVYVKQWGRYLAFAEKRSDTRDDSALNLVMRTGKPEEHGCLEWSPIKDLREARKDGYRSMNPCPVFSQSQETLFLFFICIEGRIREGALSPGQTRLCYVATDNAGETWSEVKDLTETVGGINLLHYKTFAVGPGHGLEVDRSWSGLGSSTTNKRLLIPAYVITKRGNSHSLLFYSDDDGESWQAGKQLVQECGENQVAEVRVNGGTESYLYCSSRSTWGRGLQQVPRTEALSDDAGESFTKLQTLALKETPHGCQGSVLAFPALKRRGAAVAGHRHGGPSSGSGSDTWLLYSHPARGPLNGEGQWIRRDLGVFLRESLQDGGGRDHKPWGEPHILHHGMSGYSDLAEGSAEGHFACLMECGEAAKLRIVFKEFDISEIPKPAGGSMSGA
ncbi:sialidase-3-like [Engraulis encrasicolus]|uniref:sialidase-3-like n=1 Tax=Engraulis encrasicolus TaxID=184585 RepID=UPI002FD5E18D